MRNRPCVILFSLVAVLTIAETASAYYSTNLGRFISRDPIGYESRNSNLYEYADGKPTSVGIPSESNQAPTTTGKVPSHFPRPVFRKLSRQHNPTCPR